MAKQLLIPPFGEQIKLSDYDPDYDEGLTKDEGKALEVELEARLAELQEMLFAQGKHALLVVFQAMDAGGKDGAIKKVFDSANPQGVRVASFKVPTPEELSHDFLWRIHQRVPPKGYIGIFNRSHYEDVLVVRVNEIVPPDVWRKRYKQINEFEQLIAETGTRILKFYLHISKDEQRERLQARLDDPSKHWKFSPGDLPVRERWDDYMEAYEDAISHCNAPHAPWHIVPANKKWYRDLVITRAIVQALEGMKLAFPEPDFDPKTIVIPD
jgi:PPK2 family polyphosphate:nucleotide phosphotransferase